MGDRIINPKILTPWEEPREDYDVHETEFLPKTKRKPAPTECAYCGASPLEKSQESPYTSDYVALYDCSCFARSYCGEECKDDDLKSHKADCYQRNHILKIALCPTVLVNPLTYRVLSCPSTTTMAELHGAIMVAFGWSNSCQDRRFRFITQVPQSHERGSPTVTIGQYCEPDVKLSQLIATHIHLNDRDSLGTTEMLTLRYAPMDEVWEHHIFYIKSGAKAPFFECMFGRGVNCIEGFGGPLGWMDLLHAFDAKQPDPQQQYLMARMELRYKAHRNTWAVRELLKSNFDWGKPTKLLQELDVHGHTWNRSVERICRRQRSVLLVSLNKDDSFDKDYKVTISWLRKRAIVRQVTSIAAAAYHLLPDKTYQTVIVTDYTVFQPRFSEFHDILEQYVAFSTPKRALIFGFRCGGPLSQAELHRMSTVFKFTWNKDWEAGFQSILMFVQNAEAVEHVTKSIVSLNPYLSCIQYTGYYNLPRDNRFTARVLKSSVNTELLYVAKELEDHSPVLFSEHLNGFVGWLGYPVVEYEEREMLYKICGL